MTEPHVNTRWTAENDDLLRQLWALGSTAKAIAKRFDAFSRCAVIGRAHRLKLPHRGPGRTQASGAVRAEAAPAETSRLAPLTVKKVQARTRVKRNTNKPPPLSPETEAQDLPPDQSDCAVTFAGLRNRHCRYPLGDPNSDAMRFCGALRMCEASSYCARHHRLCHTQ